MTSVKLKLNKDRIRRDGTYPLVFQLIHQRRKKLIYTPFKLRKYSKKCINTRNNFLNNLHRNKKWLNLL